MERIKLKVLGITYSQIQSGAYALVLAQEGGPYRIPVVVGVAEAQAIAIRLENIMPPRPLPHDLIVSLSHGFGLNLDEVFLYKFENGVFLSELKFSDGEKQVLVDSRTSDAIALALRTDAPIYTTREIMEATGFIAGDESSSKTDDPKTEFKEVRLEKYAIVELEKMLQQCVEREEYERAAEIKNIINHKREQLKSKKQNNQ